MMAFFNFLKLRLLLLLPMLVMLFILLLFSFATLLWVVIVDFHHTIIFLANVLVLFLIEGFTEPYLLHESYDVELFGELDSRRGEKAFFSTQIAREESLTAPYCLAVVQFQALAIIVFGLAVQILNHVVVKSVELKERKQDGEADKYALVQSADVADPVEKAVHITVHSPES